MTDPTGTPRTWAMVPARANSKGVPKKNTRMLGGKPLILHVVDELARLLPSEQIVVSTDDTVAMHAVKGRCLVHERPAPLADDITTLDDVAVEVARWLLGQGAAEDDFMLTVQPTSPFITARAVEEAAERLAEGAGSVLTVTDDRHLRWTIDDGGVPAPLFERRVNRQWLPDEYRETGGVIGCRIGDVLREGTRIVAPFALVVVNEQEALDIDTWSDWMLAEYLASRRRIAIRADAGRLLGMGHAYRALALWHALDHQEVRIFTRNDGDYELGYGFLSARARHVTAVADDEAFTAEIEEFRPALTIVDTLDTSAGYIERLKTLCPFVVTLEDFGPGAGRADLVINDLYTDGEPSEQAWFGLDYALVDPQFEAVRPSEFHDEVGRILVTFGGTDPGCFTEKALAALQAIDYDGEVVVVLGPGYSHGDVDVCSYGLKGEVRRGVADLAVVMAESDLALTSAGRTVTELMIQLVPTIALCQNERELMHTHATSSLGITNLGLGTLVSTQDLASQIQLTISNAEERRRMRERMRRATAGRSNETVVGRIIEAAEKHERWSA